MTGQLPTTAAGGINPPAGPGRPRTRTEPTRRLQVDIPAELMDWLESYAGKGRIRFIVERELRRARAEAAEQTGA